MFFKNSQKITEEVKRVYDEIASQFDQTRQRVWLEFKFFKPFIKKKARILDLGCGNGRLYKFLKEFNVHYIGLDQSSNLLEKARKNHPELNFELGNMTHLCKFENESLDTVLAIASFHHLPTKKLRKKCLSEIHRTLKKEGYLILTVWNLFQKKYIKYFFQSILGSIIYLGLNQSWNDLWVKWSNHKRKRYYHAFLPNELKNYFSSDQWKIIDLFFVKKGKKVPFSKAFNICMIVKKK